MMQTIYLLRHFKVKDTQLSNLNSDEFTSWVRNYDFYELEYKNIELPKIDKAYVSSQNRAIKTANYLKLDYEESNLLVEVEAFSFVNTKLRFPKWFWLILSRTLWFFNLIQFETKKQTVKRVEKFLSKIEKEEKTILIISHGLFLKLLINQLKKRDFKSNNDVSLKNGKLYKLWK